MKNTLIVILLAILGFMGYTAYQNGEFQIVRSSPPPAPVIVNTAGETIVTVTPVPAYPEIDFAATTEAHFATLPTSAPQLPPTAAFFGDFGLPAMGPYTAEQANLCKELDADGRIEYLISPQREICDHFVGK